MKKFAGLIMLAAFANIAMVSAWGADVTPPTVSLTAPSDQELVYGAILVEADASDASGIKKVGFYVDNGWIETDHGAPYEFAYDTTALSDGSHSIYVKAFDQADNSTISPSITVVVDNTSPTVSLTSPADQGVVGGTIQVEATASDANGIQRVALYIDGAWIISDNTAPYQFDYDTTGIADGAHAISVKAVDNADNSTTTSDSTVVVDNTNPSGTLVSPQYLDVVGGTIVVTADATDNVGVKKVSLYVDDTYQSIDFGAPYELSLDTTGFSEGYHSIHVKVVDLAGNNILTSNTTVVVDNIVPSGTVVSPQDLDSVNGTIVVTANAADNVFVKKVALYVDGVYQSIDFSAPYEISYDTTGISDGEHVISVKIVDLADNFIFTDNITVTVQNAGVDMRTRARLLGYLFGEGSCVNPNNGGDKFALGLKYAQNERALWCAQQMEAAGELTIVSATDSWIVLKDLPWDVPYAPVSWNPDIYMTFNEGLPRDPSNPSQWAPEVYNPHFIAAIIEGEGSIWGAIDDQSGWGNFPIHVEELRLLLEEPEYDCDPYLINYGKTVKIANDKFYVVREYEYVSTSRVPGGPEGLVEASTPPAYASE